MLARAPQIRHPIGERQAGRIVVHDCKAGGTGYLAGLGVAMEAGGLALPHVSKASSCC